MVAALVTMLEGKATRSVLLAKAFQVPPVRVPPVKLVGVVADSVPP